MSNITFNNEKHEYRDNAGKLLISVSQLIHCFIPEFDPDGHIARACAKREGISEEEIKARWAKAGTDATKYGTKFHEDVETYIKTKKIPNNENKFFIEQFSKLGFKGRLQTETILFSLKDRIAGTCDVIEYLSNNEVSLGDWKSNKKGLDKENKYKKFMLPPFEHLPATKWISYNLQLNLYSYLMEQRGYWTVDMNIFWINPESKLIEKHPVKFMPAETKELIKFAKNPPRHKISIEKQQEEETEEFF